MSRGLVSTGSDSWHWTESPLPAGNGIRVQLSAAGQPVSYRALMQALCDDAQARRSLIEQLVGAPYPAYFWEMPAVTRQSFERPFEYALIEAASLLEMPADPYSFSAHFEQAAGADVVSFSNLGGDARLIAPCPAGPHFAYVHLASFVRSAPVPQVNELLRALGRAVLDAIGENPLWISTCGTGVGWLHVRLDSFPKYYSHAAYREIA